MFVTRSHRTVVTKESTRFTTFGGINLTHITFKSVNGVSNFLLRLVSAVETFLRQRNASSMSISIPDIFQVPGRNHTE